MRSWVESNHRRKRGALLASINLLVLSGLVGLLPPKPAAAVTVAGLGAPGVSGLQATLPTAAGAPGAPPPGSAPPGGTQVTAGDCAQLASALQAAPALAYFPHIAAEAQQCGLPATQPSAPPSCGQLTAAIAAAPWLQNMPGPQHVLQTCPGGTGASQAAASNPAQPFDDLQGYGWAAAAIGQLAQLGVLKGVGAGRFDPAGQLTRAQFAALLQRTFQLQAPAAPVSFADVQASDWFYNAVEAAAAYMTGAQPPGGSSSDFQPDAPVTRIDAAAALGAILIARGTPVDSAQQVQQVWAQFSDGGQVPAGVAADAATAVTAGLMVGEGGAFAVDGHLTRAQAAVLFQRVLNQSGQAGGSAAQGGSGGSATGGSGQSGGSGATTLGVPQVWPGSPVSPTAIPIGDGKVSSSPEAGYVYSCTTSFRGGGARHGGPWIDTTTNTWNSTIKPKVQGSVTWPSASHSFSVQGDVRVVSTNDLPEGATTGIFPISPTDPAYQYDTNPNHILPQSFSYSLPVTPTPAATPSCLGLGPIGVTINGVVLFDALDAAGRDAGAHEIQDSCDGHPQSRGIYHYHFLSTCIMSQVSGSSTLVGYALDGYGIYVERDAQGNLPTDANLDACHGRTSQVMWDGKPTVMYHYDVTLEYPYTVGCYHGTPVAPRPGQ